MKLETEYRSVAELREERKLRLNSIFDVESASKKNLVIKSGLFYYLYTILLNSLRRRLMIRFSSLEI